MTKEDQVRHMVREAGADLCGIAAIERFADFPSGFRPEDIYAGCRSVVVLAKRLPRGLARVSPQIVYNHTNSLSIQEVDRISYVASLALEHLGCTAIPLPADSPYEYWEAERLRGRGILSMRHTAVAAGLGCLGKSTLLLNKTYGNFLTLGAILTDLELISDPLAEPLCPPNCRRCLDSCPTGALDGKTVNQQLCRPHTYTTNARGYGVVNCNNCRMTCPRAFGQTES